MFGVSPKKAVEESKAVVELPHHFYGLHQVLQLKSSSTHNTISKVKFEEIVLANTRHDHASTIRHQMEIARGWAAKELDPTIGKENSKAFQKLKTVFSQITEEDFTKAQTEEVAAKNNLEKLLAESNCEFQPFNFYQTCSSTRMGF